MAPSVSSPKRLDERRFELYVANAVTATDSLRHIALYTVVTVPV